jgi:GT2 family glycosyltransferase
LGDTLSVVISVCNGAGQLDGCLRSIAPQRTELAEVIVVDDGSTDDSGRVAVDSGCTLLALPERRGISTARNAGARRAAGDVLVFIDADTVVKPGWAAALKRAYAGGAVLAGGEISWPEPRTLAEWYTAGSSWHDAKAKNGFLPFVSGCHFTIRREVFLDLGGFDESMPLAEDLDLSLRAQLAGYPISFVLDAGLVHTPRPTIRGMLAQRVSHARGRRLTEIKFRRFPFLRMDRGQRGVVRVFSASATRLLLAGTGGDSRRMASPFLGSAFVLATRIGMTTADLQLLSGRVPMPEALDYADPEQHNTASPLPGGPSLLLLGDDRVVMGTLRLALEHNFGMILAPPGLEQVAVPQWDAPAPWSLRLARSAVRGGWPVALETTALRLEREQPRTWGEAFVTLHRVHAWAHSRPRFGLAARGEHGWSLAAKLPDVPIVIAGEHREDRNGAILSVTRRELVSDRRRVYQALREALAAR